uniref:Uncharacterized protein n=1 Tax=Bacteriophage sp. TaxID=38018 RepID=A0A8D9PEV0_9VIRU|nr:MAG TPA: hypothetical protein [Bacteriophage sp.]
MERSYKNMIYKPSQLLPNLNEIDILSAEGNKF